MYNGVYDTEQYIEPLKSFDMVVGHIPLSRLCLDCAKNDLKKYSLLFTQFKRVRSTSKSYFKY